MNNRLKKALLYGVWFAACAPLMGFLFLAILAALGVVFKPSFLSFVSLMDLLQFVFGTLLVGYVVFGLPAFFTGVVFTYCCHRPYSTWITGGLGALFSFVFAFICACLVNGFFGFGGYLSNLQENIFIALAFSVLAFVFGSLLAFLFKEKLDIESLMVD